MRYPIVLHTDDGRGYGVTVPDLPGCFSAGDTLDEAYEMAQEAICCHIEGLLMDAQPIPKQQPMRVHMADPYYADGVWAIVDVDLSKLRVETERIEIELLTPILNMIDQFAARSGESRSGFLAHAALQYANAQLEESLAD